MSRLKRFAILGAVVMGACLSLPAAAQSHNSGGHGGGAAHAGGGMRGGGGHGGGWHGGGGWYRGGPGWWGVGLGLGLGWDAAFVDPYYYGYPYSGYAYPDAPPAVVVEPSAPVDAAPPNPPPASNWYYCDSARGYYPYVKECPEGWRMVPATPAPPAR